MKSITIITIVVVVLLTAIIFGLAWLGYSSCIKSYKMEVRAGKHDDKIWKEYHTKKKNKAVGIIGLICSYAVLTALTGLFITGVVYKANGENFTIKNQTALVIKSGSMSGFYNEELATRYQQEGFNAGLQFDTGDICIFEKISQDTELVKGEVYGYKYRNIIITHRLISIDEVNQVYKFRGDANGNSDGFITRDKIVYHYTGQKVSGIGVFVLYAQSYFGIWSMIGIVGIAISSEIVYYKIKKIEEDRDKALGGDRYEK